MCGPCGRLPGEPLFGMIVHRGLRLTDTTVTPFTKATKHKAGDAFPPGVSIVSGRVS